MRVASVVLLLLALTCAARAGPALEPYRRYAIVVGASYGAEGDVPLRFAHKDAQSVAQVLRELGGVRQADLTLLLDPDAAAVTAAFAEVAKKIAASSDPALLVFYYSGHADGTALHLGPRSRLAWAALGELLHKNPATLRLGLVDACQAGSLTAAKGFVAGAPATAPDGTPRGTALLVAASSVEVAQESADLGGSVFTHYLISGLRGGADADDDGEVTLAEANAYATRLTLAATSSWAPRVQHPLFDFDISGHGEVVLADLREGAARVALASALEGHVVITDKQSHSVVVEADKVVHRPLTLALPAGRYQVHLRKSDAIYVAELELPWGGTQTLEGKAFSRHSYQEVAMKGGVVELHRQRLSLGVTVQGGLVSGFGAMPGARLSWGWKVGELELGVHAMWATGEAQAVDTTLHTTVAGGGLSLVYEQPRRRFDLRLGLCLEAQVWRQSVDKAAARTSLIPGAAVVVGLRLPFAGRWFADVAIDAGLYAPELEAGRTLRGAASGVLGVGLVF